MQNKYAPHKSKSVKGRTRRRTPEYWKSGPDPLQHEMYYAWAKHRSQAHYRKETYLLTYEDWQQIWANPADFLNRGRHPEDLTLTRCDPTGPWSLDNVEVMVRIDHLRREIARRGGKV
jgi:hypothetical protein